MESLLEKVKVTCRFAMDWRNRRIAHRDLDLSLGRQVEPLAHASKEAVETALDSLGKLLNRIELRYLNTTVAYGISPLILDAASLLYVLRDGLKREAIRTARLAAGEYRPEDWNDDAKVP